MSEPPFHIVGGSFSAQPQPVQILASQLRRPATETPTSVRGSRRRKLWEIPHKFHCPVIGVCFDVDELRGLMSKVMHFPRDTGDFVLHTTAVGACEERSQLATILHKHLEKRFALTVRRFAAARDSFALAALWQDEARRGCEIPAALWACWTHPACDAKLEQQIYGDIHMIQHQIGSGARADIKMLNKLRTENQDLRQQLDKARQETSSLRQERAKDERQLNQHIIDLRAELSGRDAAIAHLQQQLEQLHAQLPELRERQQLLQRASAAEARNLLLSARANSLEAEIGRQSQRLQHTEEILNDYLMADAAATECSVTNLSKGLAGKCVLCVGGRTGAIDAYRQRVEHYGGHFIHHDGGVEESLHRIDGALSGADLVICQAGCISHNAYWRIKDQCKRTGKPCRFVRNAGLSSFERVISDACAEIT